ncbi:WD40 repeat-like protein [Mycena venus]|uniref:Pre-mRNA-splicing factor PRP46 n=1 Tax=Mycena venus TaxID=2733690 RepID=A0A8H6XJ32_9AGAR|nr:WD40 repeat-like protein [Mycena venus]
MEPGGQQDHRRLSRFLHRTLHIVVTADRNTSAQMRRDMLTKARIHESEPQVFTGSMDSTIRLWDLTAGKTRSVYTLAIHLTEYSFTSSSAGGNNSKKWKCPEGAWRVRLQFQWAQCHHQHSVNAEGVFSGADNGSLSFWDYNTGTSFQSMEDVPQSGSLEGRGGHLLLDI